ncbi:DUF4743 domain-containing protein [Mesosutterella sp. OilRF-GAM-744-9]|uniref:DUF4743 domain-containing protein n=1 Tax=Mesosutterella porci TaxID=2915351 RepID=A0ABS9MSW9_9BURK|nr:DUF4743 domain-containing protein [Mesosutterella sp. oilRF-744-WT-GAM-9]MCG5031726.1 DUF4743 domain-containing protein [Mesosutterella sp. oilRF-744-WT-GAM-9]
MTDTKWRIGKSFCKYSKIARTPLDPSRTPFLIGGIRCGSASPEDAKLIAEHAEGFSLDDGAGLVLHDEDMDENARTEALAAAAVLLRDQGRIRAWRGELLEVRACEGGPRLAVLERSAFRLLGLTTLAVHMNGVTPDGRIWTSRRAQDKAINPGRWDNLAAGMVAAGEQPLQAMRREAHEEAGLEEGKDFRLTPSFRFFSSRPTENGWLREASYCYLAELSPEALPHNLDGEVDSSELLTADAMAELIARGLVTQEAALTALFWLAAKTGKKLPEGFYRPLA